MGNLSIEEVILLNKDINQYFKEYFKKFGIEDEYNIFELNFEKVFKTILFKRKRTGEGVKKKYAGRMIWYKGKPRDEINITGFECVRSDSPKEGRKFFKEVLGMILYEKSKEEIDIFIEDFKNKIRTDKFEIEDISFPISISKPLESYGNQIHAKAARYANQKHDAGIKQGDKIKYIFVIHPDVKVVAFKDYFYGGYRINYDKLIYRMVDLKIGPIYEQLGWQYKGIIFERAKKIKEKTFEKALKQLSLWN